MEINNLTNLIGQNELYSNGNATARKGERIDPATQQIVPPSAIYHGSKENSIALYQGETDITLREGVFETEEDRLDRKAIIGNLPHEVADNSASLKFAFDDAAKTMPPELLDKDWGFSVTDGELVILEGHDDLSESERKTIFDTLSEFGVGLLSDALASGFIAGVEAIRGPYETGRGIAKYDITEENFGEIVNLRAYLDSHTEDGKYSKKVDLLKDEDDMRSAFFLSGLEALYDQVSVRAEPKYA